jgi:carboxyl-terminal processing protease
LQFKTPKGKIVYGGGGIIPDVFVAIDTTSYVSSFYFNTLNNFAFDYVDKKRKELSKWTVDHFITNFDKDETVLNSYLSKIKDKVKPSFKNKKNIKKYLKSSIANMLFGDVGFYKVIHKDDKMIQKVLELESINE